MNLNHHITSRTAIWFHSALSPQRAPQPFKTATRNQLLASDSSGRPCRRQSLPPPIVYSRQSLQRQSLLRNQTDSREAQVGCDGQFAAASGYPRAHHAAVAVAAPAPQRPGVKQQVQRHSNNPKPPFVFNIALKMY